MFEHIGVISLLIQTVQIFKYSVNSLRMIALRLSHIYPKMSVTPFSNAQHNNCSTDQLFFCNTARGEVLWHLVLNQNVVLNQLQFLILT